MNKVIIISLLLLFNQKIQAQTYMRLWQGGESERMNIAKVGDMLLDDQHISIKNVKYNLVDIDSIVFMPELSISYEGSEASVSIPKSMQPYISVSKQGAHVVITNTNQNNEVCLRLQGESGSGSLTYNGAYKCTFVLSGLKLTNPLGAAMNIQCGKRVALVLAEDTQNTLTDGVGGSQKAALYCRGHLEIEGSGALTLTGNAAHALSCKEYIQLKKNTGMITIAKAIKDAIHCNQYFRMSGGNIRIDKQTAQDGIQVDIDLMDDNFTPKPDPENTGDILIRGGEITAVISGETAEGIKAAGKLIISGGHINIQAIGAGSRGMRSDAAMIIGNEDMETDIKISAAGVRWMNPDDSSDRTRCTGIRAKAGLTINGGTINVTNTGNKSRGIHITGQYQNNGGNVTGEISLDRLP